MNINYSDNIQRVAVASLARDGGRVLGSECVSCSNMHIQPIDKRILSYLDIPGRVLHID